MPLYEYECTACHKRTEKIQKFSDAEITVCPKCGGVLERVITAPAIAFKGGGWFADGYGNAKPAAASGSGEGNASETKTPGENKGSESKGSESKPSDGASPSSAPSASPSAAPAASAPAASTPVSKT